MGPQQAKLLLVDDEPLQLKVLKTMIDTLPYAMEVVTCKDGQEAIDYLENPDNLPPPDIIITDYIMPEVDGLELLTYVRKRNRFRSVSVLMVSAFDQPELQEKALKLGVDDFLRRPLNRYEMQARCNSFIHFSHHVKGTLEHAVFFEHRLANNDDSTDENQNDALDAFIQFAARINHYSPTYLQMLTGVTGLLAENLNLGKVIREQLIRAIQLHGLGLALTTHLRDMKNIPHYEAGSDLLGSYDSPVLQLAEEICRYQEEWFDGSGAPEKLSGIDIPLAARIASIAIYVAELYSKNAKTDTDLAVELAELAGTRFDPELIEILHENKDAVTSIIELH